MPARSPKKKAARKSVPRSDAKPSRRAKPVRLLSGGNPQIAKADGDAAVEAYLAAMPGWKQEVGRKLDALITRTIPNVNKAVRWNSPFYGTKANGWFLSFHCITRYIKVAFFNGTSLKPMPPVESKHATTRYLHIHETDWTDSGPLDEKQLAAWIKQASKLPGWASFNC